MKVRISEMTKVHGVDLGEVMSSDLSTIVTELIN